MVLITNYVMWVLSPLYEGCRQMHFTASHINRQISVISKEQKKIHTICPTSYPTVDTIMKPSYQMSGSEVSDSAQQIEASISHCDESLLTVHTTVSNISPIGWEKGKELESCQNITFHSIMCGIFFDFSKSYSLQRVVSPSFPRNITMFQVSWIWLSCRDELV